jgi:carboxyl-terminal processing protease
MLRFRFSLLAALMCFTQGVFVQQSKGDGPPVEQMQAASSKDAQIVKTCAILMSKMHLAGLPLDDEISGRAYDSLMKSLDPLKIYFLQSDLKEFEQNRTKIDEAAKAGKMDFAIELYKLFLKRMDERIEMAHKYIDSEHDFTAAETIVKDSKSLEFAKDAAEANDRIRRQVKFRLLSMEADRIRLEKDKAAGKKQSDVQRVLAGDPNEDPRERLHRSYRTVHKRWHQMDSDELLELWVSSVTTGFDPHTSYMSPNSYYNFMIQMKLGLDGIGAQLTSEDGYTKLTSIVPGGAADKDGRLKPGDKITAVGQGESGPMEDVIDMKLDEVVRRIRGTAGTIVRLAVSPASGAESLIMSITRAKISLDDSAARSQVIEHGKKSDGSAFKVGYIDLPSFYMDMDAARANSNSYRSTTRDVNKILADFRQQSVDTVVLDLSRNGGGSLTEAINLTGLFIDRGPVVQVKDPGGQVQVYDDEEPGVSWSGPLVVMTSKESASASEILAGAIQDYGRGLIVGDPTTHGKGTVQSLFDIGERFFGGTLKMGALKITIQQFYLPAGKSTQRQGVLSDLVLPNITAEFENGEADLDYALPNDTVEPTRFQKYNMVKSSILSELRNRSTERVRKSEGFAKALKNIELYRQQKEEETISLNREEFLKRMADLDAQREEDEQNLDSQIPKKEVFRNDHYNKEILEIAKDYFDSLNGANLAQAG